jgi:hypothetical protein
LGHGLAVNFPSLREQLQNEILKLLQDNSLVSFSDGFSKGLKQSFEYLSKDQQEKLVQLSRQENSRLSIPESFDKIQKNSADKDNSNDTNMIRG